MGISQEENIMKTKSRFAGMAMILAMAVMGTTSQMVADQGLRLNARQNKQINGFEAELRGDYREKNGSPDRLNSELEKINLPTGVPVAFCLVQGGTSSLLGVDSVARVGGVPRAEFELEGHDGDTVPKVSVGDILEAHQTSAKPFLRAPNSSSPVLMSAPFTK
jgi:hypothetical protein